MNEIARYQAVSRHIMSVIITVVERIPTGGVVERIPTGGESPCRAGTLLPPDPGPLPVFRLLVAG